MSKAKNLSGIFLILFCMWACSQEEEKIIFKGPHFIFLDSEKTLQVYESDKEPLVIPISVSMSQPDNLLVTYEIISEGAIVGSDFIVQSANPLVIPAGKFSSNISIKLQDNAIIQSEVRKLTVKIVSVNTDQLNIDVVKEVMVSLLDDDCAATVPKITLWTGEISIADDSFGAATGTGSGGTGGICGGTLSVTGHFFNTQNPITTMTIKFIQNSPGSDEGLVSVARFQAFESLTQYEYEATGTYNEINKKIVLNYVMYNTADDSSFTGTQTLTGN